jgi:hypothetical protein
MALFILIVHLANNLLPLATPKPLPQVKEWKTEVLPTRPK